MGSHRKDFGWCCDSFFSNRQPALTFYPNFLQVSLLRNSLLSNRTDVGKFQEAKEGSVFWGPSPTVPFGGVPVGRSYENCQHQYVSFELDNNYDDEQFYVTSAHEPTDRIDQVVKFKMYGHKYRGIYFSTFSTSDMYFRFCWPSGSNGLISHLIYGPESFCRRLHRLWPDNILQEYHWSAIKSISYPIGTRSARCCSL